MISDRKLEHLLICENYDVEFKNKTTGFEDVELIHNLAAAARAARQDLERAQSADVPDIASLLAQLDALWGQVDAIPAANDAADASDAQEPPPEAAPAPWWQRAWREAWSGAGRLVRVSRIDRPDKIGRAHV